MVLIEDSWWEPIKETDKQQFCVEMMKRLDIQRRMSVVSPTSRFAYKSFRPHLGRFAYTIKVVSPTQLRLKID